LYQVESGWTIAKLCATLSWFEVISNYFYDSVHMLMLCFNMQLLCDNHLCKHVVFHCGYYCVKPSFHRSWLVKKAFDLIIDFHWLSSLFVVPFSALTFDIYCHGFSFVWPHWTWSNSRNEGLLNRQLTLASFVLCLNPMLLLLLLLDRHTAV